MHVVTSVAFAALMLVALVSDVRTRRLPNRLTVAGFAAGLLLRVPLGFAAVGEGILGAGLALLIGFPLVILGALGGGDAKLLAAVGAFMGPERLVAALLASGLLGGLLAIGTVVWRRTGLAALLNVKDLLVYVLTFGKAGERVTLDTPGAVTVPYGVAIAIGSLAAWFLPLRELVR